MTESIAHRGGIAAIAAGIAFIVSQLSETLDVPGWVTHPLEVIFFLLMTVTLFGMSAMQAGRECPMSGACSSLIPNT